MSKINKLIEMFEAVDKMPEDIQRFCVICLIGEDSAINMKKELLSPFLKCICLLKPENMNAIAVGVINGRN
jgi:hypothetical protein